MIPALLPRQRRDRPRSTAGRRSSTTWNIKPRLRPIHSERKRCLKFFSFIPSYCFSIFFDFAFDFTRCEQGLRLCLSIIQTERKRKISLMFDVYSNQNGWELKFLLISRYFTVYSLIFSPFVPAFPWCDWVLKSRLSRVQTERTRMRNRKFSLMIAV